MLRWVSGQIPVLGQYGKVCCTQHQAAGSADSPSCLSRFAFMEHLPIHFVQALAWCKLALMHPSTWHTLPSLNTKHYSSQCTDAKLRRQSPWVSLVSQRMACKYPGQPEPKAVNERTTHGKNPAQVVQLLVPSRRCLPGNFNE